MTNVQNFFYPSIHLRSNRDFIVPNLFPQFKIIRVKWKSILGVDNKNIIASSLANSPKFINFVKATREDFKTHKTNLKKYPKMNGSGK